MNVHTSLVDKLFSDFAHASKLQRENSCYLEILDNCRKEELLSQVQKLVFTCQSYQAQPSKLVY